MNIGWSLTKEFVQRVSIEKQRQTVLLCFLSRKCILKVYERCYKLCNFSSSICFSIHCVLFSNIIECRLRFISWGRFIKIRRFRRMKAAFRGIDPQFYDELWKLWNNWIIFEEIFQVSKRKFDPKRSSTMQRFEK